MNAVTEKSSTGLDANLAALLSYAFWWLSGIIFLVVEKDSRFVRFHAMQSTIALGGLWLIAVVVSTVLPIIGWLFSLGLWVLAIIVWIICMIKAYQGEWFKLPVVGDIAEKQVGT